MSATVRGKVVLQRAGQALVVRAAERAAEAANLVVGFRPRIRNPHMRLGVFSRPHSASEICIKKPNFINGRSADAYILGPKIFDLICTAR